MHPPLGRPHPSCQDVIDALNSCHKDNEMAKFFGFCNEAKANLDACFRAEKELRRKLNYDDSMERKQRADAYQAKKALERVK